MPASPHENATAPRAAPDDPRSWLGERPRGDRIAERLALERLEARLLDRQPAAIMFARYVMLSRIGRGGLGSVYEAYDPELDRKVAIKVLHEKGRDPNGNLRLTREAQALARLAHPNVVAVHDIGVTQDGTVFVAMELVQGVTLVQWWRQQPRTWKEVRDVLEQAGRGLLAAHEAGLVHRDFKPGNVLVGPRPAGVDKPAGALDVGHVRVLDFGLARAADAIERPQSAARNLLAETVTGVGTWLGTPAYTSPEQINGQGVGPWSDQFSFCVTLYEGLYGVRPFTGDDVEQTLAAVARCRPSPPPVDVRVPAWLHRVVLRGLSRDAAQRFASMADLLEAMVADRRSRRRQRLGAVAAVVLTAALGAAGATALTPSPTPAEEQLVDRLTHEARAAAAESYFVYPPADDAQAPTAYRKVLELEAQAGAAETLAADRAETLREEFAATLVRLGDQYWDRAGGAPFASDYYAAALVFDPELEHARSRTTLSPGEVRTLGDKAADGDFSSSELIVGESLAVLAEADPRRKATRARALLARPHGPAASTTTRVTELVAAPALEQPPPPREATNARSQPAVEAREELAAAAARQEVAAPPPEPPVSAREREASGRGDADALVAEAAREAERGNTKAAEDLLHRALAIKKNHPRALGDLAHLAFEGARYHRAIELAERAVAGAPKRARYWLLLGDARFRVMAYDDARRAYQRAAMLGQGTAKKRLTMLEARVGGKDE